MQLHHPVFDHHIVRRDVHISRVRIVANADVAEASAELGVLFPHETVLATAIGCCHHCVYTDHAPASHVADRIAEHLLEVQTTGDGEPAPRARGRRLGDDDPLPDFFDVE